jgi:hypothetical protein
MIIILVLKSAIFFEKIITSTPGLWSSEKRRNYIKDMSVNKACSQPDPDMITLGDCSSYVEVGRAWFFRASYFGL